LIDRASYRLRSPGDNARRTRFPTVTHPRDQGPAFDGSRTPWYPAGRSFVSGNRPAARRNSLSNPRRTKDWRP